jgi:hypothetical protein
MKIMIFLAACLFSITGYAQTKLIAFRSHSGSNAHFRTAVEKDLFDIGNSNFGIVEVEKIDSVIKESKNSIIVIRKAWGTLGNNVKRDTLTRANNSEFFAATDKHSLKLALHFKYIKASVDSINFVGFGRKFKSSNRSPKK